MKKSILFASFCLFMTAAIAQDKKALPGAQPVPAPAAAQTSPADMKNAPEMTFEVEEHNFGTIKQGDKVSHDFEFANTGKEPLIITGANGSCGCTVPLWPKEPISKGAKGTINVEFNSTGKMGMQDKTVTIVSNAKSGQRILRLKGNVETPTATPATETPGTEKK